METLSIGQVARRAGVGVETIRFYERVGLLEEPPRRASGYRVYSEQVIKCIRFIKRAQQLGFSLKEITELLLLRVDGQTSCEEVKQHTEAKIARVTVHAASTSSSGLPLYGRRTRECLSHA
jgi:DNA-binding transcriptional MerR regulator